MRPIEVAGVALAEVDPGRLWGYAIDIPAAGKRSEAYALEFAGWVLGRASQAVSVEVVRGSEVLRSFPLREHRPDVALAHPEVAGAEWSGFRGIVNVSSDMDCNSGSPLDVQAVLEDRSRVALGVIQVKPLDRPTPTAEHEARRRSGAASWRALILLYHRVSELPLDSWELSVTPQNFAEHLQVLRQHGRILRLNELHAGLSGGDLPDRAVVVSFDDGYADNLHQAKPLLERFDIPATFFLTTGYLDQEREFWWDELERLLLLPVRLPAVLELRIGTTRQRWELGEAADHNPDTARPGPEWRAGEAAPPARYRLFRSLWELLRDASATERGDALDHLRVWAGAEPGPRASHRPLATDEVSTLQRDGMFEVGAHTVTHPSLAALPVDTQYLEMNGSKAGLERLLGKAVSDFAYPHGQRTNYSEQTIRLARSLGFQGACAGFNGLVRASTDPFELPRAQVKNWDGDTFAAWLSGQFHRESS
jgi:peptidoglycan/xylan/chitin deacetylase (PgdA/CDA1 family)